MSSKQEKEWKTMLAERKDEIRKARAESIREKEREQAAALARERRRVEALESRGLIARLLNRPVEG